MTDVKQSFPFRTDILRVPRAIFIIVIGLVFLGVIAVIVTGTRIKNVQRVFENVWWLLVVFGILVGIVSLIIIVLWWLNRVRKTKEKRIFDKNGKLIRVEFYDEKGNLIASPHTNSVELYDADGNLIARLPK